MNTTGIRNFIKTTDEFFNSPEQVALREANQRDEAVRLAKTKEANRIKKERDDTFLADYFALCKKHNLMLTSSCNYYSDTDETLTQYYVESYDEETLKQLVSEVSDQT